MPVFFPADIGMIKKALDGDEEAREALASELQDFEAIVLDDKEDRQPGQCCIVANPLKADPSGRRLWLTEWQLKTLSRALSDTGFLEFRTTDDALNIYLFRAIFAALAVTDVAVSEIDRFRESIKLPSGYMPKWNHGGDDGQK